MTKQIAGLRANIEYVGYNQEDNWEHNEWKVTLRYKGRQITTPFKTGMAISEPTAMDVMSSLVLDHDSAEFSRDFEDFCAELGYDTDSRKAEKIYNACKRNAARVKKFLGDDFDYVADIARNY